MALESEDWKRVNEGLLRLYAERTEEGQGRVMMELIMWLVPADSIAINHLNFVTGQYTMQVAPDGLWSLERVEEIRQYLHQSPFPAYHLATGDDRWKMTTDFMPLEDFRATGLYRSLECWNVEAQMCALLGIMDQTAHAITVHRTSGEFEEREREILDVLHPHLVTSFLNVKAFEKAHRSVTRLRNLVDLAPGAYGYLEPDGTVAWIQPRAFEWLGEFFPDGQRAADGLPIAIAKLRQRLTEEQRKTGHLEWQCDDATLFACLTASPMSGWMLRLEKRKRNFQPRFRILPELSPRQNEVLRWMVEGKRNREIAVILGISHRTVEKHAAAILEILGVENRATAIVRAMELGASLAGVA